MLSSEGGLQLFAAGAKWIFWAKGGEAVIEVWILVLLEFYLFWEAGGLFHPALLLPGAEELLFGLDLELLGIGEDVGDELSQLHAECLLLKLSIINEFQTLSLDY